MDYGRDVDKEAIGINGLQGAALAPCFDLSVGCSRRNYILGAAQ